MGLSPTSSQGGGSGGGTVTSVTAADASIVVAGTAAAPTLATGPLSTIAALHPATAVVDLASQKITSLANGTGVHDGTAFGQLTPFDATRGQNGMWACPNVGYQFNGLNATGQVSTTQGTVWAARFVPTRNMSIVKIGFSLTAASTTNDQVDVGLYDATGARLVRLGATSALVNGTTGPKIEGITTQALVAGTPYYAAFWYGPSAGVPGTLTSLDPASGNATQMFGTAAGTLETTIMFQSVTGGLPTTLQFNSGVGQVPALAVLES